MLHRGLHADLRQQRTLIDLDLQEVDVDVRQLIRSAGARLFYLPKYSPDLNPIEQVFAKLKHFLRKAAARTVEAVCLAIGKLLKLFTPEECLSYLANAGYGRT